MFANNSLETLEKFLFVSQKERKKRKNAGKENYEIILLFRFPKFPSLEVILKVKIRKWIKCRNRTTFFFRRQQNIVNLPLNNMKQTVCDSKRSF